MWSVALLSFIGGLLGAGIPAVVTLRGQQQGARSEWRQRFDRAIDLASAGSAEQRRIGDALLTDLITSDLGSPADRDLADRIARIRSATRWSQQVDRTDDIDHDASG